VTARRTPPARQGPSAEPATVGSVDTRFSSPPDLTVVCAWCEAVVRSGAAGPVSHGICRECARSFLERLPFAYLEAIADDDGTVTLLSGYRFPLAEVRQDGSPPRLPGFPTAKGEGG